MLLHDFLIMLSSWKFFQKSPGRPLKPLGDSSLF